MKTKSKRPVKATRKPRKAAMKQTAKPAKPAQDARIVFIPMQTSGVRVDEDKALTYSAVWGCVRVIAETLASLSWHVLARMPGGGKERQPQNPVEWMLQTQANLEMSAGTWRETLVQHALLWGNGYAEIERDGAGRPVWLWPLAPDRMCVKRDENGTLYYEYHGDYGETVRMDPRDVFHLKGIGFDGLVGYPVIRMAAQSIGLGLAMETNGAAFFGNGSRPNGILRYPGKTTPDILEETRKRWMQQHGGPRNAHRVAVVDDGLEWVPVSLPNEDAQWLEGRQFQVSDICRWFRVPPHKLAELSRATFSNIEHQSIEFVTDTILPWAKRLEQEADLKLFGRALQGRLFTKLNINSLLRGDTQTRFAAYQQMLDRGVFSINEVRDLEDMNGIGPDGDKRLVPLNMQLLEKAGEEPVVAPPADSPPDDDDESRPRNRLNGNGVNS